MEPAQAYGQTGGEHRRWCSGYKESGANDALSTSNDAGSLRSVEAMPSVCTSEYTGSAKGVEAEASEMGTETASSVRAEVECGTPEQAQQTQRHQQQECWSHC